MAELIYEVSFKGVASPTLRAAFADYVLRTGAGVTSIRCSQGALGAVMSRVEELGLELLDVQLVADQSAAPERRSGNDATC
jgi:hypothetical protein